MVKDPDHRGKAGKVFQRSKLGQARLPRGGHDAVNRWGGSLRLSTMLSLLPMFKACAQPGDQEGLQGGTRYGNHKFGKDPAQASCLNAVPRHLSGPRQYSESLPHLGKVRVESQSSAPVARGNFFCCQASTLFPCEDTSFCLCECGPQRK